MFLVSVVLSVGLSALFAEAFLSSINGGNLRFVSQQEPSTTQGDQAYGTAPNMPQSSMEENQPIYPMPQQSIMQPPMMQGFQSPFSMNPVNQQQLSLLIMSAYARMMALTQLMSLQNRYPFYQPNQYSDPSVNNYGPTPAPLPYAQQPQVDLQNNLQNEMLQRQQEAESQQKAILEQRRVQREYDMDIERRKALIQRKAEEDELEKQQQEVERQLRDKEEI
nr:ACYPI33755 [Acyrthosiphon pisum]